MRAAGWLDHYQRGRVGHYTGEELGYRTDQRKGSLVDYEGQLVAFPNAPHDDMVDAAGAGGLYFLDRDKRRRNTGGVGGSTEGYSG